MRAVYLNGLMLLFLIFNSCTKDEIDDVKPVIDTSGALPAACDTLRRGTDYEFKIKFSDNIELGSFSIDIHHNFDQHSHSTGSDFCVLDQKKTAVKPWTLIRSYEIPAGLKEFNATGIISIPKDIDQGDYHFWYKLTDKSGWQSLYGFSIKILD